MASYVLGHSARERDRLILQGQLYADATRRAFVDAGITRGMRVLDVGCGSGDVTRLAAELVGPTGSVLGVDRDVITVADAKRRSAASGHNNVSFAVGDIGFCVADDSVDAVVGRFVLMHQANPGEVLAQVVQAVRPNGIVVFVESHMASLLDGIHSRPKSVLYDELVRWKCDVVRAAGADLEAGLRLRSLFDQARMHDSGVRLEAPIIGGTESDYYRYMAESVRSMLPHARACGIGGMDEARVDQIEHDLRSEVVSQNGVLIAWPVVAAWCRRPPSPQVFETYARQ